MREIRIFSALPLSAQSGLTLGSGPSRHISQVLRMQPGQELVLFDGSGGEYSARIEHCGRNKVAVRVGEHKPDERESPLELHLLHGLCRSERMDSVVQKATELGVTTIRPILTARSVIKLNAARAEKKRLHWQNVAISACEQSGRNRIPEILAPLPFAAALKLDRGNGTAQTLAIMLDPSGTNSLGDHAGGNNAVGLWTGPEGGFTADEVSQAKQAGFKITQAGPRILRTETAPIVALSILQLLAGDLGVARN